MFGFFGNNVFGRAGTGAAPNKLFALGQGARRAGHQIRTVATESGGSSTQSGSRTIWGQIPNWAPPVVAATGIGILGYGFKKHDDEIRDVRTEVQGVRDRLDELADRISDTRQELSDRISDTRQELAERIGDNKQSIAEVSGKLDILIQLQMNSNAQRDNKSEKNSLF